MINALEARKLAEESMATVQPVLEEIEGLIQAQASAGNSELVCAQDTLSAVVPVGEEKNYPFPELLEKVYAIMKNFGYKVEYKPVGKPYSLPSERNEDGTEGPRYARWALVITW